MKKMKTIRLLQCFACCLLFMLSTLSVAQSNVLQHTVAAGETLYGLSRAYGVSIENIVAANPGLSAETLQAGKVIRIPRSRAGVTISPVQSAASTSQAAVPNADVGVAVVLPFTATGVEGERSVEFYRGFLAATEQIGKEGKRVNLFPYDEKQTDYSLQETLQKIKAAGVQLLVGPVYPAHFAEVAVFCRVNRIRMIVPFYSKAEQVNTNPWVYLVNTPQKFEFEHVADLFLKTFKDCNVAIMHVGDSNNGPFVSYLRRRLMATDCAVTEFSEQAPLEQMRSACSATKPTVVVPDAADVAALSKVLAKMEGFRKYYPSYPLRLFGYPKWLSQADAQASRLQLCNTYIYTDSYPNGFDAKTRAFLAAYESNYGEKPLQVWPRMCLLGHDVAQQIVRGMLRYGDAFAQQAADAHQLQSAISFERTEQDGGLVNKSLFFINYKPDGSINKLQENR